MNIIKGIFKDNNCSHIFLISKSDIISWSPVFVVQVLEGLVPCCYVQRSSHLTMKQLLLFINVDAIEYLPVK